MLTLENTNIDYCELKYGVHNSPIPWDKDIESLLCACWIALAEIDLGNFKKPVIISYDVDLNFYGNS